MWGRLGLKNVERQKPSPRFFYLIGNCIKLARVRKALNFYGLWRKCRRAQPDFLDLISQNAHFFSDLLSERRAGDAADAGFFQRNIHLVADFAHGKDDFVRRDS